MTAPDALVGWTGLVGSNLLRQRGFDVLVNSRTSHELRGGRFGHVVLSAARAEKWRANADPAADAAHIDELIALLGTFTADRLTVVSTVDVFPAPIGVDETAVIDVAQQHAYGAGRYRLEQAARAIHGRVLVVRLPGLFGPGLKKNVVYDLLHDNALDAIQPASSFQYYDLERLSGDLAAAWAAGLPLAHLVTEPITTARVVAEAFEREPLPRSDRPVVHYDVRTAVPEVFGGAGSYVERAARVLERLRGFVASVRVA